MSGLPMNGIAFYCVRLNVKKPNTLKKRFRNIGHFIIHAY